MRRLLYAIVFVVVAIATYLGLGIAWLTVVFLQGGGISCTNDCTSAAQFVEDHRTFVTIVTVAVPVAAGVQSVRLVASMARRRRLERAPG